VTALATTTREAIGLLLASTHRTVHIVAPAVPVPPCLVLVPDVGWITPDRIGSVKRYELRLKVLVVARDNSEGINEIEEALEDVMGALATTCLITEVTPPATTDIGAQGSVLVSEIKLSIQVKE
jgi:hypothetical protein